MAKTRTKRGQEAALAEAPEESTVPEPGTAVPGLSEEDILQAGRCWYVVHTYSGYEDKVRSNLEQRVRSLDAGDLIDRVLVPFVTEIEIRDGQRRSVPKKIFPGYVLVQMIDLAVEPDPNRASRAWFVVRNTPGVTGFVGSGTQPTPLEKKEVLSIFGQMRSQEPKVKVGFQLEQSIRITDGPFQDFIGTVDEINTEKGKVKVLVSFFGRETPVELDFLQVERL